MSDNQLEDEPVNERERCQYIHGQPGRTEFRYCHKPVKNNSPYCPTHHAKCHKSAGKPAKSEAA